MNYIEGTVERGLGIDWLSSGGWVWRWLVRLRESYVIDWDAVLENYTPEYC